jgi:hypothetical protein
VVKGLALFPTLNQYYTGFVSVSEQSAYEPEREEAVKNKVETL